MSNVSFNHVALSQSRLERIESAQTLGEAQRMGLFDKIVDLFRGGVKSEAIKQAFDLLHAPAGGPSTQHLEREHGKLLMHFNVLQNALRPEYMDKCKLTVQRDDAQQTWSYRMEVDGKTLVSASDLPMQSGHTLTAFEDHAMLARLGSYLQKSFGADSMDQRQMLLEDFGEINAAHGDLTGSGASIATLEKFRRVADSLGQLGAPGKGCFPGVELSPDLASAELFIGNHSLGSYPISSRQVLTDTLRTMAHVCSSSVNHMLQERDIDAAVYATVQDMVDDTNERKVMESKVHDPFFCGANFTSAKVLENDPAKFTATFRDPAGVEKTLVFSNRLPTNSELRGTILQEKLAGGSYETLADLIGQRFGTPLDSEIPYLTTPVRFGFTNFLLQLENEEGAQKNLGFSNESEIKDYFQEVKKQIGSMQVGNTNLETVWGLKTTEHGSMIQRKPDGREAEADAVPPPVSRPQSPGEMDLLLAGKA